MILKITNKTEEENKKILISFGKQILEVSETSSDWNNEGINNFLIKLASSTPDGEEINIEFDENDESTIFKHIVELFKSFVDEYNKTIK